MIGGASGKDAISIDRDLVAINARQAEQFGLPVIDYCLPPFLAQWQKQSAEGERAWLVRPRMGGGELVGRWTAEGFVSLAATHLGEVPAGADRRQPGKTYVARELARHLTDPDVVRLAVSPLVTASALFAGLSVLPKKSALTDYSYRLGHDRQQRFLAPWARR